MGWSPDSNHVLRDTGRNAPLNAGQDSVLTEEGPPQPGRISGPPHTGPQEENGSQRSRIGVVHLVRAANGIAPLRRFLESFRLHPPGVSCDLVLVFKGFHGNKVPPEYIESLRETPHIKFFVGDTGYDILPYFKTARHFPHDAFCFMNSFSVILGDGWLGRLHAHLQEPDVGLVGATGSWQSIYSDSLKWHQQRIPLWKRAVVVPWKLYLKKRFDPFPNFHVRTTAFMISREAMLKIRHGRIRTKMAAWIFESGKNGLTKQILATNKRALIVGRNGRAYRMEEWSRSGTFWQGRQENLLVADKQTQRYDQGDQKERDYLEAYAWWDPAGQQSEINGRDPGSECQ